MLTENTIEPAAAVNTPAPRKPSVSTPSPSPQTGKKKSHWLGWLVTTLICLLIAGVVVGYLRKKSEKQAAQGRMQGQAIPIVPGVVKQKDVPIYLDGLGTVQAFNTVTVHVRVDGQLKKVDFVEGQDVRAGDLLAEIDPDPFQAALEQAIGKKGQDAALLTNSQIDLKREVELYAAKIDSQQVYDTQKALVDQYLAAVQADQAAIDSAQVQLNYTKVTSPLEGRTGLRQVDQGNIVHAADTNGLVVITQLKPISVMFTLPEQNLQEIHQQTTTNQFKILAVDRDNKTVLDTGTLAVIDNQIDTTTGTLRLKATFPNEQLKLWPGQFLNVRMLVATRTNALTVPAPAIQRGPDGAFVFVIDDKPPTNSAAAKPAGKKSGGAKDSGASNPAGGGMAERAGKTGGNMDRASGGTNGVPQKPLWVKMQKVTVAPQIEANESIINSGLQKGDRVVVDGQYKLQDGSPVRISTNTVETVAKDTIQ